MSERKTLLQRLAEATDLTSEVLPGQSLIELHENQRVLIENHMGVLQYETCEIRVRMKEGCVTVSGSDLRLDRMTADQLLITGKIFGLSFAEMR